MNALTRTGGTSLIPHDMDGAMRLANMMATSKLVPAHLRGSPGDCLMVVEQAMRWGMSPFAVAQSTSVIQGKLMFEGKLVSAALHNSGIMASRLDWEFTGAGETRAVTARAVLVGEAKPREITVTLAEAKTSNQMWVKQPDQQLVYFSTRAWGRRHAPEVMLGVYSPEEFDALPPPTPFSGTTIEGETTETKPIDAPQPKRTMATLLDEIEMEFTAAQTRDAVDEVLASEKVQKALDLVRGDARVMLDGIIRTATERTEPDDGSAMTDDPA